MKKILLLIAVFILTGQSLLFAHPGNTDINGGHTCRTNCEDWGYAYGEYHRH